MGVKIPYDTGTKCKLDLHLIIIHSYTKNQFNISKHSGKKVVTTKYLDKFQSPRAITRPKIIGPKRNVNSICNLSQYTHIPNIKSISQSIAKKKCFISELRTWVTLMICPCHFKWWGHRNVTFKIQVTA